MANTIVTSTAVHTVPADLRKALLATPKALSVWNDVTPLARSEWVCWVTSGKKQETRNLRIEKALSKLKGGMRRPCCWIGCVHRSDKAMSATQKWVLGKGAKKRS